MDYRFLNQLFWYITHDFHVHKTNILQWKCYAIFLWKLCHSFNVTFFRLILSITLQIMQNICHYRFFLNIISVMVGAIGGGVVVVVGVCNELIATISSCCHPFFFMYYIWEQAAALDVRVCDLSRKHNIVFPNHKF